MPGRGRLPTVSQIAERHRDLPPELGERLLASQNGDPKALLAGRPDLLETFDGAMAAWNAGRPSAVAIVGPRGSGLSSLITALRDRTLDEIENGESDEERVVSKLLSHHSRLRSEAQMLSFVSKGLELEHPASGLEELVAQLVTGPRRIVFVEDLQDMLLRVVDGTRAIEAFLGLIARTANRVLWVVSCRRQTWRILEHQFGVSRIVPTCLAAELPDRVPIDTAVERWNGELGHPIRFLRDDPPRRRRPPSQEELAGDFLTDLWRVAGGNLMAARLYWLDALEWDDEAREIGIRPLHDPDLSTVRTLPRDQLFSLLSILQHGGLKPAEHAEIYLTDPTTSRRVLEALVQVGLADPLGGGAREGCYDINPAADRQLIETLENLNLLY